MPYRPTEKTKAHKAAQYSHLLNQAVRLVAQNGFQGLTISKLARQADLATGSVYKYFESKAQLCAEVFKSATEREVEQVRVAALSDTSLSCRLRLIHAIQVFSERALDSDRLAYALIAEPVDPTVETQRLIYRQAYADIYAQLIAEGIGNKEFPHQNVEITATALVGVIAETLIAPLGRKMDPRRDSTDGSVNSTIDKQSQAELLKDIQQFCLRAVTGMPC